MNQDKNKDDVKKRKKDLDHLQNITTDNDGKPIEIKKIKGSLLERNLPGTIGCLQFDIIDPS